MQKGANAHLAICQQNGYNADKMFNASNVLHLSANETRFSLTRSVGGKTSIRLAFDIEEKLAHCFRVAYKFIETIFVYRFERGARPHLLELLIIPTLAVDDALD
jgi:hypothetical protein